MNRIFLLILLSVTSYCGFAQDDHPVSWKFSSEKIDKLTYRVKFEATIKEPYHIYPQESTGGGLGMPTEFLFMEDPNLELIGVVQEKALEQKDDEILPYYKKGVTFTQNLKLKSEKETTLKFTINYIACTDFYCLPPSSKRFTIVLSNENKDAIVQNNSTSEINKQEKLIRYEGFEFADTLGRVISSKEITSKARYTYIDFWASWCIPCRAQGRELIPIYNKYKSSGFNIIGVSLDTNPNAWRRAIRTDGYSWTNVSDLKGYESAMIIRYGFTAIPRSFLIDSKGNIVAMDLHGKELEKKLAELFR